jgi:cell division protein FtsI/penicillin-binding protein 2
MADRNSSSVNFFIKRTRYIYVVLVLIFTIFGIRLFYVQIIRYGYYHTAALSDQLKQYEIPASRGIIEAQEGNNIVPIVLNQNLYTLFADPLLVNNVASDASVIASIIGGSASTYQSEMKTQGTQYVILATKITSAQSGSILKHQFPGIGTQGQSYRIYPDGSLASQTLGFVNNNGQGQYGLEQYLNNELTGAPGELKAITDANGVPLVASGKNVRKAPIPGDTVVTTINLGIQEQMEQILQSQAQATKSQLLSAVILDPNTGQVKAMANYPTYNPANYASVSDTSLFQNAVVTNAIEPGSSMKTLTTPTALNLGVIQPNTSFYDPAKWVVDGFTITDIEQDGGPRQQNIASILSLSLNTGAVWMLMQMGGGQINQKGINDWYNYMTNHYRLGQITGVEQGYESAGYVPTPDMNNPSIDLTYAETAFGQGVTMTAMQEAAAFSSVINGGTYYKPTLVASTITPTGETIANTPKVEERNTVAPKVGQEMIPLLENVVTTYLNEGYSFMNFSPNYMVGGKTGTAQIAAPTGGYYPNTYNGTYVGFVGGDKPQYVIVVFNNKPTVPGYAGALAGQPVFAALAHMLINDAYVTPKS